MLDIEHYTKLQTFSKRNQPKEIKLKNFKLKTNFELWYSNNRNNLLNMLNFQTSLLSTTQFVCPEKDLLSLIGSWELNIVRLHEIQ